MPSIGDRTGLFFFTRRLRPSVPLVGDTGDTIGGEGVMIGEVLSTLFSLFLVRTLTTRLLFLGPEPGVEGLACTVLGPKAWLLPAYVLTGFLASGSGAHESTGKWSEGSMTLPSKPTIGSLGLRSVRVVSFDLAFLFGDSGI